jgi:hypothetical protein
MPDLTPEQRAYRAGAMAMREAAAAIVDPARAWDIPYHQLTDFGKDRRKLAARLRALPLPSPEEGGADG